MTHPSQRGASSPVLPPYLYQFLDGLHFRVQHRRVNLALEKLETSFPGCGIRASYHSPPCAVIGLRNPHVLIPGPQPSAWWKSAVCQGHCSPQWSSSEQKGGKAPFSVVKIAFLTLSSHSFEGNREIKLPSQGHCSHVSPPPLLDPPFWESLLLLLLLFLYQHLREPVMVTGSLLASVDTSHLKDFKGRTELERGRAAPRWQ